MGWGDEIMVTGEARRLQATDARPVCVLDRHGRPRWSALWTGNPRLTPSPDAAQTLRNGSGARPYYDYARSTPDRWAYSGWRATPGELPQIPVVDHVGSSPLIILEPSLKPKASPNKQWGRTRWEDLVVHIRRRWPRAIPTQLGTAGTDWLPDVLRLLTPSFPAALPLLARARAAVLPEGGLHHAAAALGLPAVVLFGGMTSPRNTGYGSLDLARGARHVDLAVDDPDALGWRVPHPACAAAWDRITPAAVSDALAALLEEGP